jgi:hypothetical protein
MSKKSLFLVVVVLLIVLVIFTPYKNNNCHRRAQHLNGSFVLPDIIHDNVRYMYLYSIFGDVMLTILFIMLLSSSVYYKRLDILLTFVIVLLICSIIKMIYAVATVMPDSKGGHCNYNISFIEQTIGMGSCNDLGVSGHLLSILGCLWFLSELSNHRYFVYYLIVGALCFFTISASRNHYTIDCMNSVMVFAVVILLRDKFVLHR